MENPDEFLDLLTKEAFLVEKSDNHAIRCSACAHRCLLRQGQRGICKMRFNRDGHLYAPWGYVASAQVDPIEKKPFAHLLPGSLVLTFGMLGCNFHCNFCQNWEISQVLQDKTISIRPNHLQKVEPEQIIDYAKRAGAKAIASSYNEPLITTEWAVDIFRLAKEAGLRTAYVSNGYATPEALKHLRPYLDAYKIDLKSAQDQHYRQCGGQLKPVTDTIRLAWEMGLWVEVVTLVIPDFNDSPDNLWEASRTIASVSTDIPWHVTAFHPQYHMTDRPATSVSILQTAAEIGQEAGLHYVYAGNIPGRVGSLEDTLCPACQYPLIKRRGFTVSEYNLTVTHTCPKCAHAIPGIWTI